jgi:hypothetical protein
MRIIIKTIFVTYEQQKLSAAGVRPEQIASKIARLQQSGGDWQTYTS